MSNEVLTHEEYLQDRGGKPYKPNSLKRVYKPSKDKEQNKIERLNIRVSKDEKQKIYKAAEDNNMSISDYILTLIGLR